jgi:hypothetical protein
MNNSDHIRCGTKTAALTVEHDDQLFETVVALIFRRTTTDLPLLGKRLEALLADLDGSDFPLYLAPQLMRD